jgi:hypothetical protein
MFFLRLVAVCICCYLLFSCGPPEHLSEQELSRYIIDEDHDLSKSIQVNDKKIQITYRPTDLLVAQELNQSHDATADEVRKLREKYDPYYYFIVSFSDSGKEVLNNSAADFTGFSELLQTISFRMADVINLTTPKQDTIPLADFVYNRTFGLSKSTDILVVFSKTQIKGSDWIQVNLDEFGLGVGKQSLRFDTYTLDTAPKIFKP